MGFFSRRKPTPPARDASRPPTDAEAVSAARAWLAQPDAFGREPDRATLTGWHERNAIGFGAQRRHRLGIVAYGYDEPRAEGRVLLGLVTWSFRDEGVERIADDALLTAYIGWAFVFRGVNAGTIQHGSPGVPLVQLAGADLMRRMEVADGTVRDSYRIGSSTVLEFEGTDARGRRVRGACDAASWLVIDESQPLVALPAIYTYLGGVAQR